MADLLDLVPATAVESVKTELGFLVVRGLRGPEIAKVLSRFPHLLGMMNGINAGSALSIAQFGEAMGPIIAIGSDHPNDEKYEQQAALLLAEDQVKLMGAILRLTFPNGLASFLKTITTFVLGSAERDKPIKMRSKKSQLISQASSAEDSPQTMQ